MGAFTGLKGATRGYDTNKMKPGRHVVRIDECAFFDTEQYGEKWKNTLTVLASDNKAHREGEVVHTMFSVSSGKKVFQQKLKGFMAGVLDCADEDIDEAAAELATSEDSPMKGLVTVVTATENVSQKTKDEDGNPVTYLNFTWSPSLSDAEIIDLIGEEKFAEHFPGSAD